MTPVRFKFMTPEGNPLANTAFEIELPCPGYHPEPDGVVLPRMIEAMTDANGEALIELWPLPNPYQVVAWDPVGKSELFYKFIVPVLPADASELRLQDIIVTGTLISQGTDPDVLAEMIAMRVEVLAARDAVNADRIAAEDALAAVNNIVTVGFVNTLEEVNAELPALTNIAAALTELLQVHGISAQIGVVAANVADITNFSDVYLGPKAAAPTTRNDTTALVEGDLYFNTVENALYVYTGTVWQAGMLLPDGSIATIKIADEAITAEKLATVLNLAGKTVTADTPPKTINSTAVATAAMVQEVSAGTKTLAGNFTDLVVHPGGVAAEVSVYARELILRNANGHPLRVTFPSYYSANPATGGVGVGGLDAGTVTGDTWYYVYVISNGTDVGVILSLNEGMVTPPTLPAGYTYWLRVGAAFWLAAGYWKEFYQQDRQVTFSAVQVLSAGAATSWTSINIITPGAAPRGTKEVSGYMEVGSTSAASVSLSLAWWTIMSYHYGEIKLQTISAGAGTPDAAVPFQMMVQPFQDRLAYKVSGTGATGNVYLTGFTLP